MVWGFKDLRLSNPHAVDVVFECFVEGHSLIGRVYVNGKLPDYHVQFIRKQLVAPLVQVDLLINGTTCGQTIYEQKQGIALSPSQ